jgi:hypothetical protein
MSERHAWDYPDTNGDAFLDTNATADAYTFCIAVRHIDRYVLELESNHHR